MYKLIKNGDQTGLGILRINSEENTITTIPSDSANKDWQEYQAWLAADPENQPEPAEE